MKTKDEECLTYTHEPLGTNYTQAHRDILKEPDEYVQGFRDAIVKAIKDGKITQSPDDGLDSINMFAFMDRVTFIEPIVTNAECIDDSVYFRVVWKTKK